MHAGCRLFPFIRDWCRVRARSVGLLGVMQRCSGAAVGCAHRVVRVVDVAADESVVVAEFAGGKR